MVKKVSYFQIAFYFILKVLFVLRIFKIFVFTFWSRAKNDLIRNIWLITKFMTSQSGQQIITMHILPNITHESKETRQSNLVSQQNITKEHFPSIIMQKVRQRAYLNILITQRAFTLKQKAFLIIFKGISFGKNCLRLESAPLMRSNTN